jgi:hypothetical protein
MSKNCPDGLNIALELKYKFSYITELSGSQFGTENAT